MRRSPDLEDIAFTPTKSRTSMHQLGAKFLVCVMLGTLSPSCPNPELRRARSSRLKPWLVLMAAN